MEENETHNVEETQMEESTLKKYFCTVTPLSKYLAMVLFVVLSFVGFWIGLSFSLNQQNEEIAVVAKNNEEVSGSVEEMVENNKSSNSLDRMISEEEFRPLEEIIGQTHSSFGNRRSSLLDKVTIDESTTGEYRGVGLYDIVYGNARMTVGEKKLFLQHEESGVVEIIFEADPSMEGRFYQAALDPTDTYVFLISSSEDYVVVDIQGAEVVASGIIAMPANDGRLELGYAHWSVDRKVYLRGYSGGRGSKVFAVLDPSNNWKQSTVDTFNVFTYPFLLINASISPNGQFGVMTETGETSLRYGCEQLCSHTRETVVLVDTIKKATTTIADARERHYNLVGWSSDSKIFFFDEYTILLQEPEYGPWGEYAATYAYIVEKNKLCTFTSADLAYEWLAKDENECPSGNI